MNTTLLNQDYKQQQFNSTSLQLFEKQVTDIIERELKINKKRLESKQIQPKNELKRIKDKQISMNAMELLYLDEQNAAKLKRQVSKRICSLVEKNKARIINVNSKISILRKKFHDFENLNTFIDVQEIFKKINNLDKPNLYDYKHKDFDQIEQNFNVEEEQNHRELLKKSQHHITQLKDYFHQQEQLYPGGTNNNKSRMSIDLQKALSNTVANTDDIFHIQLEKSLNSVQIDNTKYLDSQDDLYNNYQRQPLNIKLYKIQQEKVLECLKRATMNFCKKEKILHQSPIIKQSQKTSFLNPSNISSIQRDKQSKTLPKANNKIPALFMTYQDKEKMQTFSNPLQTEGFRTTMIPKVTSGIMNLKSYIYSQDTNEIEDQINNARLTNRTLFNPQQTSMIKIASKQKQKNIFTKPQEITKSQLPQIEPKEKNKYNQTIKTFISKVESQIQFFQKDQKNIISNLKKLKMKEPINEDFESLK